MYNKIPKCKYYSNNFASGSITSSKTDVQNMGSTTSNFYSASYQNHQKSSISHSVTTPQQNSFPGQYSTNQTAYQSSQQGQFPNASSATGPFPSSAQPSQYNSSQNQFSGQSQFSTGTSTLPHQSQFPSAGVPNNSYSGQSQYSGYQNSTSSFPSHPQQSSNFASSQGTSSSLYPTSTPPSSSPYNSQSNSYQSPAAGSYHTSRERDTQSNVPVSSQSNSGATYPSQAQSSNLKPASTQSASSYNSQSFNSSAQLQPAALSSNKLGDSLSKLSMKDSVLENHQSSQVGPNLCGFVKVFYLKNLFTINLRLPDFPRFLLN